MIPFTTKKQKSTCFSSRSRRRNYRNRRRQDPIKPEPIALKLSKKGSGDKRTKGTLDYKNLPLLRQYLTIQGKILPRRKTKLTAKEQRQIARTIKTARVMGFLPFIRQ